MRISDWSSDVCSSDLFEKLSSQLRYIDGDYNDAGTFERLRRELGGAEHPLHYLAIPPSLFATVVRALDASGSARGARVVVEKPFGRDLASAQALNATLHEVSHQAAIFRTDHYLATEAVQNLPYSPFANPFLHPGRDR